MVKHYKNNNKKINSISSAAIQLTRMIFKNNYNPQIKYHKDQIAVPKFIKINLKIRKIIYNHNFQEKISKDLCMVNFKKKLEILMELIEILVQLINYF